MKTHYDSKQGKGLQSCNKVLVQKNGLKKLMLIHMGGAYLVIFIIVSLFNESACACQLLAKLKHLTNIAVCQ